MDNAERRGAAVSEEAWEGWLYAGGRAVTLDRAGMVGEW